MASDSSEGVIHRRTALATAAGALVAVWAPPAAAKFEGTLEVKFDDDGRTVTLLKPYTYVSPDGTRWTVPVSARVDGASIPRPFWPIIGGPFEGKYRNASVIHDWFCDRRNRPWRKVHRMFYDAMVDNGVDDAHSRIMYAAVERFGPRWSEIVVDNNKLADATLALPGGAGVLKGVRIDAIASAIASMTGNLSTNPATWEAALKNRPRSSGFGTASRDGVVSSASFATRGDTDTVYVFVEEQRTPTEAEIAQTVARARSMTPSQIEATWGK